MGGSVEVFLVTILFVKIIVGGVGIPILVTVLLVKNSIVLVGE